MKKETQKIYEIEGKKYAMIQDKLVPIETPTTTTTTKTRTDMKIPAKSRADVPEMIKAMTKDGTVKSFGFMVANPKEKPYSCIGITKFYQDHNIQLTGFQRVGLNYAEKHMILEKQLQGETPKIQARIKKNCIEYLTEKLNNPPVKNRWNKPISEKQLAGMTTSIKAEIGRWNASN